MRGSIVRDGVVAGLLGATAVAVWFLIADTAFGQPFATPAALGRGLVSVLGTPGSEGPITFVAAYTLFHYAAFVAVGLLVSLIIDHARSQPAVLAGAMMLFVAFEVGFYAISTALRAFPAFGSLGGALVASGNLIAAGVMGGYMWRRHPELRAELATALNGTD